MPDIAFAVSRICSATSRAPKWAAQTAYQLIRHLNATQGLGLWYRRDANFILESVSDASFAPGGAHSHGCVITTVAGAPVAWKSCKQPFPALSTAEAELIEVIEAVVVGDSIACLVDEMVRDVPKFLKCDNTAAVSIASCATGAWRTRHLKVRAAHLKRRIQSGQWELKYQPGRELIADIGTKALPVARVNELRQRMRMSWQPDSVDEVHEGDKGIVAPRAMKVVAKYHLEKAMRIVVVLSALKEVHGAMAENVTERVDENVEGDQILYLLSVMMMLLGMVLMKILQRCRLHWGRVEEEPAARRVRVSRLAGQASSGTRSSTRLQEERGRESSHREGERQRANNGGLSASSLSPRSTSVDGGMGDEAQRRREHTQSEPHEEPPNQADLPGGHHLQITLTGRRRRFPSEPTWKIWFAESSQCFHRQQSCRGLRKANRVREQPVCGECQRATQGQRSLREASFVYEDQLGTFHTDARCNAVIGPMVEIRQCKICGS